LLVFALLSLAGCDAFAPRPTCEGRPRSQCVEDLSVGDGAQGVFSLVAVVFCVSRRARSRAKRSATVVS